LPAGLVRHPIPPVFRLKGGNMLAKINRDLLLRRLKMVSPGLHHRHDVVDQATCFILRKGYVVTYNEEIACRHISTLPEDFKGAVTAQPLLKLLDNMTEEKVRLVLRENEMLVEGRSGRSGVSMDDEIRMPLSALEKPTSWKRLGDEFAEAISLVKQCAGRDANQWRATCVHITPDWVEASDNVQAARYLLRTGVKENHLVRAAMIGEINGLGMTKVSESEKWLHFKNDEGMIFSCLRYAIKYPDIAPMLEVGGEKVELPKGLIAHVKQARVFSSELDKGKQDVIVTLRPGEISVRCKGYTGWHDGAKRIRYGGEPIMFYIPPDLLIDLIKTAGECVVTKEKLFIQTDKYTYMTCLGEVKEKKKKKKKVVSNGKPERE
jgi:hypothetical protein